MKLMAEKNKTIIPFKEVEKANSIAKFDEDPYIKMLNKLTDNKRL